MKNTNKVWYLCLFRRFRNIIIKISLKVFRVFRLSCCKSFKVFTRGFLGTVIHGQSPGIARNLLIGFLSARLLYRCGPGHNIKTFCKISFRDEISEFCAKIMKDEAAYMHIYANESWMICSQNSEIAVEMLLCRRSLVYLSGALA